MGGANYQMYDLASGNSFTSTTATPVPAFDATKWRLLTFDITVNGGETATIQGSLDGGTTWRSLRPIDWSTGAVTAAVTLASGAYLVMNSGFPLIKVIKSAAVQSATINISGRAC